MTSHFIVRSIPVSLALALISGCPIPALAAGPPSEPLTWLGSYGGGATTVALDGYRTATDPFVALVGVGETVWELEFRAGGDGAVTAESPFLAGEPTRIVQTPCYLYVALAPADADVGGGEGAFVVLERAGATMPIAARRSYPGGVFDLDVSGDRLVAAVGRMGLVVFDLAEPARPEAVATVAAGSDAWSVEAAGDLAFVAGSRLDVVDLAAHPPRVIGGVALPEPVTALARSAGEPGRLYAAGTGFHVVDVSDPSAPRIVTSVAGTMHALDVHAVIAPSGDDLVFVGESRQEADSVLRVFAVASDRASEVTLGDDPFFADECGLRGFALGFDPSQPNSVTLVVADGCGVSLSDPDNPITLAVPPSPWPWWPAEGTPTVVGMHVLAAEGNRLFQMTEPRGDPQTLGFRAVDTSSPNALRLETWFPTDLASYKAEIEVVDGFAYVGPAAILLRPVREEGLAVIDTSGAGAASATRILPWGRAQSITDLAVDGARMYVTDSAGILSVFDLAEPGAPVLVSRTGLPGSGPVAAAGNLVAAGYLACDPPGEVALYDVADATSPVRLGAVPLAAGTVIHDLVLRPPRLYVTVSGCGANPASSDLITVDIVDARNPFVASAVTVPGYATDLEASAGYLYLSVADVSPAVLVLALTDPDQPTVTSSLLHGHHVSDLEASEGLLYALADEATIRVFRDAEAPAQSASAIGTVYLPFLTVQQASCP